MITAPDHPIWNELPEGVNIIELDGEVVGFGFPEDLGFDREATDAVLTKAGFPPVAE